MHLVVLLSLHHVCGIVGKLRWGLYNIWWSLHIADKALSIRPHLHTSAFSVLAIHKIYSRIDNSQKISASADIIDRRLSRFYLFHSQRRRHIEKQRRRTLFGQMFNLLKANLIVKIYAMKVFVSHKILYTLFAMVSLVKLTLLHRWVPPVKRV